MKSKEKLLKKLSVINVADYVNNADNDEKLMKILLVFTMMTENEEDPSSKHEDTAVDTFHNQLEEDEPNDIIFTRAFNSAIQVLDRKKITMHNWKNETEAHAVRSHHAKQTSTKPSQSSLKNHKSMKERTIISPNAR